MKINFISNEIANKIEKLKYEIILECHQRGVAMFR